MNIQSVTPRCKLSDLTLPPEVLAEIRAVLEETEYETAFREHGVPVRKKLLLHGPSGNGKTSIAHAFASELGIKVAEVSTSETIDSHLGGSAKNVASAIQYAAQNRCVLLMDEFDSLGASRDEPDHASSKSLNQMVNTLLTDLENKVPLGMIVARSYDLLRRKIVEAERAKNETTLPMFQDGADAAREIRKRLESKVAKAKAPALSEATQ